MAVQWGLQGQGFNALEALQTFGQAQQRQQAVAQQQRQQAAAQQEQALAQQAGGLASQGDFAGGRNLLASNGAFDLIKHIDSLEDREKQGVLEGFKQLGQYALLADTPEKWDASVAQFVAQGHPEAQGYIGQFGKRETILAQAGLAEKYAEMNKPVVLSNGAQMRAPDGRLLGENVLEEKPIWDSEGGNLIYPSQYGGGQQAPQGQPGAGGTFQRMIGAESGGRQFARNGQPLTSSAGAVGMAQVMPSTGPEAAKAAGLPWDPDRFRNDPEYNSRLGNAYYQKQLQAFNGDEAKAVAAYNAGPGRIRQAVLRSGDAWQESIPSETQGYLRKVLGGGQGQPGVVNVRPPKARRNTDGAPSGYRFNGENLEPIPGGPADPSTATARNVQSNRKAESEFRKEFNGLPQVKTFNTARQQFGTLRDLSRKPNPTPQDDIAMVFGYMKTLDPSSVVREGEFAQAQNAGSVPDNVQNLYNRVLGGQRLNAKQRKEMVNTAYVNYKQYRAAYNETAEQYRGYASDNGIKPDRVARTYTPNIVKGSRQAAPAAQGRISPTIRRIN